MVDKILEPNEIEYWISAARQSNSVALMLRRLGEMRGLDRFQLSWAAADLFPEKISGQDRQVIWKWCGKVKAEGGHFSSSPQLERILGTETVSPNGVIYGQVSYADQMEYFI